MAKGIIPTDRNHNSMLMFSIGVPIVLHYNYFHWMSSVLTQKASLSFMAYTIHTKLMFCSICHVCYQHCHQGRATKLPKFIEEHRGPI